MLRKLLFFALALAANSANAQQYPEHPVRVLVGFAAGSGPDLQARTIAQQLATDLKQSFFIENRLGANGTIAARAVATAPPDGLTLLFSSSSIAPTPHIYKNLGYDTLTDLRPVATSGILDGMLVLVDAKSPIKSIGESDRRGEIRPRAVRLARRRQRPASRARGVRAEGRHHARSMCRTRARRRSPPRCSAAACS